MTICTTCAGCGFYLDYAGPGVTGGLCVPCKPCNGAGWVSDNVRIGVVKWFVPSIIWRDVTVSMSSTSRSYATSFSSLTSRCTPPSP